MEISTEIPCLGCKSWNHKSKKFSCNPKTCNALSGWLRKHSPQLYSDPLQMQVQLPEPANQYIV